MSKQSAILPFVQVVFIRVSLYSICIETTVLTYPFPIRPQDVYSEFLFVFHLVDAKFSF